MKNIMYIAVANLFLLIRTKGKLELQTMRIFFYILMLTFAISARADNYDLYLTDGYVNSSLGDYNDFECITYHESVHRYNPNAGDTPNGEIEAVIQTTKIVLTIRLLRW